jgi:hypothetical protein
VVVSSIPFGCLTHIWLLEQQDLAWPVQATDIFVVIHISKDIPKNRQSF